MGYTKLFNSILGSTIWREDPVTKVVWVTMLALSNRDGIVEASIPGLAHFAGVGISETEAALRKFLSPDPYSRSPEYEGRRIEPVDGGWQLINHDKYRLKMSPDDIRERDRIRKKKQRELEKQRDQEKCPTESGTKCDKSEMSGHSSNTHTDVDLNPKENTHTPAPIGAVARVCAAVFLSGKKNEQAVHELLSAEMGRTGESAERIADRMIADWTQYRAIPRDGFRYVSPLAFWRSGLWVRPDSPPPRRWKDKMKRLVDPDTHEVFEVPV